MAEKEVAHDKPEAEGEEGRGQWSGKLDFLLSCVGYAVGLGNVWRFPYRAYANGGASFLIPYVLCLAFAGLPLFFLEMALGQFASQGPISVWNCAPFFKGLGWAMVVISILCSIYYNMVIAYTIYYVFASFTSELPWTNCRDEWIPYGCRDEQNSTTRNITEEWCNMMESQNLTDGTDYIYNCTVKIKTPSECYWEREVLDISSGIDDAAGDMRWQLVLCLLFAWVIIFLCLIKGIKSSGKVVYFTATFPYIVLIILLVRNVTLDGAVEGIKFYIIPKWDRLADANVWGSALIQIFYSLGVAFGGLETMASYNKFHNNVYRDALIVAILNCSTSVFAGFVIFSVIGFMSQKLDLPVEDVAAAGPGLAFVAYPEGLSMMPIAPLWSILFFLMLFTLGLDSQFAMMETVITALVDEFKCLQGGRKKMYVTLVLCVVLFLAGLPQCSRAGVYVMNLFEWYSAGFSLMVVALFELIAICYVYGFRRFSEDIKMMIGFKPNYYWLACWLVISPLSMVLIIVFSIVTNSPVTFNGIAYPSWADGIGWGMVGAATVFIPIVALVEYCKAQDCMQTLRRVFRPRAGWGPANPEDRTGIYAEEDRKNAMAANGHAGSHDKAEPITVSSGHVTHIQSPPPGYTHYHVNDGYSPDGVNLRF